MRVTSGMYYKHVYGENNSQLNSKLYDVNKQISSGVKIQYAKDDVRVFSETMRLDNEINILGQIKKSTQSGAKISNQTDVVLNDFQMSLDKMKNLFIQAANGSQNSTSLNAIAVELRGLEDHFRNLANTSINGKYLFAGSDVDTKPIADDGTYRGNNEAMSALIDSNVKQQYNLTGGQLFLGEDSTIKRMITTNVNSLNLTAKYPDYTNINTPLESKEEFITANDTIRDMMGDTDNVVDTGNAKHFFYISGRQSDGSSFRDKIAMSDEDSVGELLKKIGEAYGNTSDVNVVNVSLNDRGEILVQDKMQGSSKLDFHMVGATDFSGGLAADVTDISNLNGAETNFRNVMSDTYTPGLFVKEFVKSDFAPTDGTITTDALLYDQTQFEKKGSKLISNVSQVIQGTNAFATPSTKLSAVAGESLDGKAFNLSGTDVSGNPYNVQIDFASSGTTFSPDGGVTNYDIFNMDPNGRAAVDADEMTYQQFTDVINMIVTNTLPASASAADYDSAVRTSNNVGGTSLTYDGKLEFNQLNSSNTRATLSLFDATSGDFSTTTGSIMTFNVNNALTINDPKTDFFKTIDEMIRSVEENKLHPDSESGNPRNVGIQNAIAMIEDLQQHVTKSHSQVGAHSNSLNRALDRATLLEVSTVSLRSSVLDTDLAEASMQLAQLSLTYEAMLSTVGKVSKLSLVNYL
ncbi:MAG: flagellar biosynthesis protein FlgL [Helicobacteraceae bacterium]|nr:flagellar biosynthesis protein FlgL [Helicobacteraceae bacterium]